MAVWVVGSTGQVGRATIELLNRREKVVRGFSRKEIDLSHPDTLIESLERAGEFPEAMINTAAHTQVDQAEKEESLALKINAESPRILARWCAARNIPLIHFSTDYVFSGEGNRPWQEEDPTAPLNAYGRTKLAGEQAIAQTGGKYLIFRTSWVYDSEGKNFFRTMLRLGAEREQLQVVSDQVGAPTYAPTLAKVVLDALEKVRRLTEFPSGIYHLCGSGETTWHGFAEEIFTQARTQGLPLKIKEVKPILSKDYPTPAKRPLNSRLDTSKAQKTLGVRLPNWKEGVRECVGAFLHSQIP